MKLFKLEKIPGLGSKRTLIKFAYLPKTLTDRNVIWFEKYEQDQVYKQNAWHDGKWLNADSQIITKEEPVDEIERDCKRQCIMCKFGKVETNAAGEILYGCSSSKVKYMYKEIGFGDDLNYGSRIPTSYGMFMLSRARTKWTLGDIQALKIVFDRKTNKCKMQENL